jgi:hypothetical protein
MIIFNNTIRTTVNCKKNEITYYSITVDKRRSFIDFLFNREFTYSLKIKETITYETSCGYSIGHQIDRINFKAKNKKDLLSALDGLINTDYTVKITRPDEKIMELDPEGISLKSLLESCRNTIEYYD